MRKITIIVPAYNEEANLEALYDALLPLMDGLMPRYTPEDSEAKPLDNYDWEVLMVNDGSRDRTLEIMAQLHQRDPRFRYLNLSRNFGKENAMLAGFDYATGDAAVIIDADLQHPVATIPEMVYWWEQGYEDVYGKRLSRGRESWLRRRLSMSYYKMLQRSTRVDILPNVGDFRLLDRRALDALRRLRETQRYTKGMYAWIGFRKKEVLYSNLERHGGQSSFNLRGLCNLAVEGITSYTTAPLRLASVIGLLSAAAAMLYALYFLIKTIAVGDDVQGFPTLIIAILFLGGCQLLAIGIIGEYLGRIFNETKRRPCYIVESYDGKRLHAQLLRTEDAVGTILLFHGYRSSWNVDFSASLLFYRSLGYNLLLVDQRAHGLSQGKYLTFGVRERMDVISWATYMGQKLGPDAPSAFAAAR